ncbi:protein eva-1 homolog C-like isoform X2 [Atheta coriaria]|uniref:protein eva-1 homolog C-like isoform X2 n=1 Tax=Dalotia coriaria TaxID=877792 RepID=UPI0031F465F9
MHYASYLLVVNLVAFVSTDNLALLSGTLRTFQQAGCDDDLVTLKCPPGTSISVELAQYGKASPEKQLCPTKSAHSPDASKDTNTSCLWPSPLQNKWEEMTQGTWGRYSLLQTVVEACQKKSSCKFQASPRTFEGDPCPGERKYVEVAYKCRPYEFRSRVACENERIQLQCNPNSRVAIYSASYGRTEYESFQCPQPQGVAEETCLVSYATETVMQICHGKRSCEFSADASTFGNPCKPLTRMYLRIVYTCVPRKVLNKQYEGRLAEDEVDMDLNFNYDEDFDGYDANNAHIRESAASPASNLGAHSKDSNQNQNTTKEQIKFPMLTKTDTLDDEPVNQEHFYFYIILGIGSGLFLCFVILMSHCIIQYSRRNQAKFAVNMTDISVTNDFVDNISEVDDVDLRTPLPGMTVPTVTIHSPTSPCPTSIAMMHVTQASQTGSVYYYG